MGGTEGIAGPQLAGLPGPEPTVPPGATAHSERRAESGGVARRTFLFAMLGTVAACRTTSSTVTAERAPAPTSPTAGGTTPSTNASAESTTTGPPPDPAPPETSPPDTQPPETRPPDPQPPDTQPPDIQPRDTEPSDTEPEPEPSVEQPPGPAGMVCRSQWGARPARQGGRPHTIRRLTVHHSAVLLRDGDDPTAHLRNYQRHHQDSLGWVDIAYHVAVDRSGTAYQLRDTALAGDTATSYDPAGHLLILAIGDFSRQEPSEAQVDGVARVLRWGEQRFGASLSTTSGHRDHAATGCPGDALYGRLAELRDDAARIDPGTIGIADC